MLLSTLVSKYLFEPPFSTLLGPCSPVQFLALQVGAACSARLQGVWPSPAELSASHPEGLLPPPAPHHQPHCCALLGVGHVPCHLVRPTVSGHTSAASPPWCFRAINPDKNAVKQLLRVERPLSCSSVPMERPLHVLLSRWRGCCTRFCAEAPALPPQRRPSAGATGGAGPGGTFFLVWAGLPPAPVSSLQASLQVRSRAWELVTSSSSQWPSWPWWRAQLPCSSCVTGEWPGSTASKPSPTTSATRCSMSRRPGWPEGG